LQSWLSVNVHKIHKQLDHKEKIGMKLKTKLFLPVLTVIVLLGLSSTAFAQNSCGVASTPVSRDTNTGLTEVAGDLIFNCTFGGTVTTTATMTVAYGVTITNNTAYPA